MQPCELLTDTAFLHHDDQGHDALIHYAVVKGVQINISRRMKKVVNGRAMSDLWTEMMTPFGIVSQIICLSFNITDTIGGG